MPNTIKFSRSSVSCSNCGLSGLCVTGGMSNKDLNLLDSMIDHTRQCDRNQHLYHSGDDMLAIYAVRSGSFKVTTSDADGEEQVLGFYFPGELIGLEGFGETRHSCDVVALESASVCHISLTNLDTMCDRIPSLRRQLMALLGREIGSSNRKLLALGKMNAEERMATFLVDIAQRFAIRGFSSCDFNLSMSRHDIANYLGTAGETASRLLARMQAENLIEVDRRNVRIKDMDSLLELAHQSAVHAMPIPLQQIDAIAPQSIAC